MEEQKCVIVLDRELPAGLLANTAAILGISLGRLRPESVGADVSDHEGREHAGIVEFPVPVLQADTEALLALRERLYGPEGEGVVTVDFSDTAQGCKTYDEYEGKMAQHGASRYFGVLLCGRKKQVNKLTGNLPLLR